MPTPASLHPTRTGRTDGPGRPQPPVAGARQAPAGRESAPHAGERRRCPAPTRRERPQPAGRFRLALGFALLALFWGCRPGAHGPEQLLPRSPAVPLPAWDQTFLTADPRWQGADSISSVPLSAGRTLWLFGDTWVDPQGRAGRKHAIIIRNCVALQEIPGGRPGRIRFYWPEGPAGPEALFQTEPAAAWLWPLSGARLGEALYLFFIRLVPSNNALGFELDGSVLVRVPNPDDPPGQWRREPHEVPFFRHTPGGDSFFGAACLEQPEGIYIFGVREDWKRGPEGRDLLLARAPAAAFAPMDFAAWEFFGAGGWAQGPESATALFEGAATEMSVSFLPGANRFVAVYTHCGLSPLLLARQAVAPQGPWGPPTTLWKCPEAFWGRDYFCYAGKAHPELATSAEELIVTYAANSYRLEDHLEDPRIYWPRFLRVDFASAGGRPAEQPGQ